MSRVFRKSVVGIIFKFGATGIAFLASILYARALGPKEYGFYALVTAWMALFQLFCSMGLTEFLAREVAKVGQGHAAAKLVGWAQRRIGILYLCMVAVLAMIFFYFPLPYPYSNLVVVAAFIPFFSVLSNLRHAALRGLCQTTVAQFLQFLLSPILMLVVLIILWIYKGYLDAFLTLSSMLAASIIALFATEIFYSRYARFGEIPLDFKLPSTKSALPFLMLAGLIFLNSRIDQLVIGYYLLPESVGVYALAARISEVVTFVAVGFEYVLGPKITSDYFKKESSQLQYSVYYFLKWVSGLTICISIPILLFADDLLVFLFGSDYSVGANALRILVVGHVVRYFFGPGALLLNMTGFASVSSFVLLICALINLALNFLLIPVMGIEGAAFSTFSSYLLGAYLLSALAKKKIKIKTSIFSVFT